MQLIKRMAPVALVGVTLLVAGCGGSSPTNTSTSAAASGGGPKANGIEDAYKFSACMRNHGVTNFPDPVVHQTANSTSVGIRVTPSETSSPAFKTAQKACQGIMPMPSKSDLAAQAAEQRQHAQDILSFAHCLRSHGLTGFPDPNAQGNLTPQMLQAAGIDLHAPNVISVAIECVPASHGAVTAADIRQDTGSGSAQSSGGPGTAQAPSPGQ